MTDVAIRDLTIEYSSGGYAVRPIEGLDLDLQSGELVLLLGASGSGKTTLLSALAAILRPASGSITVGGAEVVGLAGSDLTEYRRRTVGVVFQAFNLIPSLTALENTMTPLWASGLGHRAARQRATELLTQIGLGDRMTHRPGDLSGGQQQRVAIARALALEPPLVLADEPTAHLDYVQVDGILRLLRSLAAPGRLVVVATHDERMLPLADRVVELTPRAAPTGVSSHEVVLGPGEVLFRQGDPGDLVYVVEEGKVQLVHELAGGGEELVSVVGQGSYFGELAPLFGLRRSASARAETDTRLQALPVNEFRSRFRPDWGSSDSPG